MGVKKYTIKLRVSLVNLQAHGFLSESVLRGGTSPGKTDFYFVLMVFQF